MAIGSWNDKEWMPCKKTYLFCLRLVLLMETFFSPHKQINFAIGKIPPLYCSLSSTHYLKKVVPYFWGCVNNFNTVKKEKNSIRYSWNHSNSVWKEYFFVCSLYIIVVQLRLNMYIFFWLQERNADFELGKWMKNHAHHISFLLCPKI